MTTTTPTPPGELLEVVITVSFWQAPTTGPFAAEASVDVKLPTVDGDIHPALVAPQELLGSTLSPSWGAPYSGDWRGVEVFLARATMEEVQQAVEDLRTEIAHQLVRIVASKQPDCEPGQFNFLAYNTPAETRYRLFLPFVA